MILLLQNKIFISNFSKYRCHSNFIKALISENISLKQAKLILYLNQVVVSTGGMLYNALV